MAESAKIEELRRRLRSAREDANQARRCRDEYQRGYELALEIMFRRERDLKAALQAEAVGG